MTLADCPRDLTVVCVPGGTTGTLLAMEHGPTSAFLRDVAATAAHVTSICTGSLVLAAAGLLRGRRATSHWAARESLRDFGAIPVDARVVTDGKFVTGAGVSAGLDFGLAVVAGLRGRSYAEALRLQAEYAPEPPVSGGTLASADPRLAALMKEMLEPFSTSARAIAGRLRAG
jgi:transcriptional regulator GlxA family with amidase domain